MLVTIARRTLVPALTALVCIGGLATPVGAVDADRSDRAEPRARPGKYVGHFYDNEGERLEEFTFRISRDGRKLKNFTAAIGVICSYYPPEVEAHPLVFPTVKVSRRHTFHKLWEPDPDSQILLEGTFRGNKLVSGTLDYTVGVCVRTGYLQAKRVRR